MEAVAYNKLVLLETRTTVLVLLRMPKDEREWVNVTEDSLEMRNCCYWAVIDGPPTENKSTIRIKIPRAQIFDQDAVKYLLERLRRNRGSLI
jgi:hypothetical protein